MLGNGIRITLFVFLGAILISCAPQQEQTQEQVQERAAPRMATADLQPTEGNTAMGTVTFAEMTGGIHITAEVSGLESGNHGFHVHETGDCSAPDGTSAGGHFNPDGTNHGGPVSGVHHRGDLGNIEADASGKATLSTMVDFITVAEGPNSVLGKAVIVHAGADDLESQPTGNAGARVACGVIQANE